MPNLYRQESSYPKPNAQMNLQGRTHYVDDDTLRFHKSRILSTRVLEGGLLFGLIESCAADPDGHKRVFRPVIFDVFGNVVERPKLEDGFRTQEQAAKAFWRAVEGIDAQQVTVDAIERAESQHADEMARLRGELEKRKAAA